MRQLACVSRSPDAEKRVERVLEESLERIDTPQAAHAVVARVERLSAGATEEERGRAAAEQTRAAPDQAKAAATTIERAAAATSRAAPDQAVARVLETGANPLAAGDGSLRFCKLLEGAGVRVAEAGSTVHVVRALHVCRLAADVPPVPPEAVLPTYLRAPDARPAS